MKQNNKALSMLSLATKAGKTVTGEFSTEKAVKEGKAYLVVVAQDASDNTKKSFFNMTDFYHVPCYCYGSKEDLGRCIGKEFRASLAVIDENLAKAVENKLEMIKTE